MKEALAEDNLVQAAEAKMTDVQSKLSQVKYDTEARHVQNAQSYLPSVFQRSKKKRRKEKRA